MVIKWTTSAERDLVRIYEFLAITNSDAAIQVIQQLIQGVEKIQSFPQLGVKLSDFEDRDVRRVIIGNYEIRYELTDKAIYILRLWHFREDR